MAPRRSPKGVLHFTPSSKTMLDKENAAGPAASTTAAKAAAATAADADTAPAAAPAITKPSAATTSSNKFQRSLLNGRQQEAQEKFVTWREGESVPYAKVVEVFEEIAAVSGRLEKENLMSKLFTAVLTTTPADLEAVVYLASNTIYPAYDGLELGIGDSLLVKAICQATGRKKDAVEEAYEKEGDLGEVAVLSRAHQKTLPFAAKPKPLAASFVLDQFRAIAQVKGEKAQARKVEVIEKLMVRCQGAEAKYLIRALQGKLRIGTAFQTVLVALSHTFADVQAGFLPLFPVEQFQSPDDEATVKTKKATTAMDVDDAATAAGDGSDSGSGRESVASILQLTAEEAIALPVAEKEAKLRFLLAQVPDLETPEARRLRLAYVHPPHTTAELYEAADIAVKRAFSECPNLSLVLAACIDYPLHLLYQRCRLLMGVPVAPMLAKPTKEIGEVLRRLEAQAFTMEYKYDGERAQVHFWRTATAAGGGDGANANATAAAAVKIFSRNSEDNSNKYADLRDVVLAARLPCVDSCIVDAEVVAYDREKQTLLPFQVLSTRKRKLETAAVPSSSSSSAAAAFGVDSGAAGAAGDFEEPKVKVILQVFDLLSLNGQSLLRESLRTRRALLRLAFQPSAQNYFRFADGSDHVENGDTAPIETILTESCAAMCEGLMVKTLDEHASYEPSKRSLNWLKLKKDYIAGMGVCDSVDLVPIGAYYGRGKRSGVYGAYLMACYEPERDTFQSVCKVGTGFSDEMLQHLHAKMAQRVLQSSKKPSNYEVGDMLAADVWFTAAAGSAADAADDDAAADEGADGDENETAAADVADTADAAAGDATKTPRGSGSLGGCVWEIQAADLSRSSVHRGGVGRVGRDDDVVTASGSADDVRGIGLRFPRFLRERDDKRPDQATTSEQIVDMFYSQAGIDRAAGDDDDADEWI